MKDEKRELAKFALWRIIKCNSEKLFYDFWGKSMSSHKSSDNKIASQDVF